MINDSTHSSQSRTCILVIGMHRSGTSAMAGCLNILGFDVGNHLIPADKSNEKGYFENDIINKFNDNLLDLLNARWHDTLFFPDYWWEDDQVLEKQTELIEILKNEFDDNSDFVIKDPRISVLFPFYAEVLNLSGISIKVIVNFRNPVEVAQSLKKRDNLSFSKSLLLWTDATLKAEHYTRPYPRVFLNYDHLLNKPVETLHAVIKILDLRTEISSKIKDNILNFIEKRLKHNTTDEKTEKLQDYSLVNDLYSLLKEINIKKQDKILSKKFNQFSGLFYKTLNFYNGLEGHITATVKLTGEEVEEISSKTVEENNDLLFTFASDQKISEITFFPAKSRAVVEILNFEIITPQNEVLPLTISTSNAEKTKDNSLFIFETDFPRTKIFLKEPLRVKNVRIKVRYLALSSNVYRQSIKTRNQTETSLKQQIDFIEKEKKRIENQLNVLGRKYNQLLSNNQVLNRNNNKLTLLHNDLVNEKKELVANHQDLTRLLVKKERLVEELIKEKKTLTVELSTTREIVERLHSEKAIHYQDKAKLNTTLKEKEQIIEELKKEKEILESELRHLKQKHTIKELQRTAHITELEHANQSSIDKGEELKKFIDEILSSKSWKIGRAITWPLRKPKEKLKTDRGLDIKQLTWKAGISIFCSLPISRAKKESIKQTLYFKYGNKITSFKKQAGLLTESPGLIPENNNILSQNQDYVPFKENLTSVLPSTKVIAFYLPQFHSILENDQWWGKGFTEWTNVKPAQPQFEGHYQPHIPENYLGYYNLLDKTTFEKQVRIAKNYGIGGFCFHYYWFGGKLLLEKPIDLFFENKDMDLPFCVSWANENWTRRWDGEEQNILIGQDHSPEDDLGFIEHVSKYFKDDRYIKISGKPLLMVYRPGILPSAKKTANRWRKWCKDNGIGEIYLAYVQSFDKVNPEDYGFDAAVEFPPNNLGPDIITHLVQPANGNFKGNVYDWLSLVEKSERYEEPEYKLFRGVCPSWDNTARRKNEATVLANSNPADFKRWLVNAIHDTTERFENKDEKLVFVNAWNEWAEGAHLEPDKRYGYAFLDSIYSALQQTDSIDVDAGVISRTYDHNRKVFDTRLAAIKRIFNTENLNAEYHFLLDYYKIIKLAFTKFPTGFTLIDNTPVFVSDETQIPLISRKKVYELYKQIFGLKDNFKTSFVILQYNNASQTIECVESLQKIKGMFDVVIVDNNSRLEEKKLLKERFLSEKNIHLLFNETNSGFAAGNNVGYQYAKNKLYADFIYMINNDTVVNDKDFIDKSVSIFKQWSYSVLGVDVVISDGRHENPYNDWVFNEEQNSELISIRQNEKKELLKNNTISWKNYREYSSEKEYIVNPILQGAALIFSPVFVKNNDRAFEEITFLYGEEFVLAAKCLLEGGLMLYTSKINILHKEGKSTESLEVKDKMINGYNGAITSLERANNILNNITDELTVFQSDVINNKIFTKPDNILFDVFFSQGGYHGGGEYGKAVFNEIIQHVTNSDKTELWVAMDMNRTIDNWVWEICRINKIKIIDVKNYSDIAELVNKDIFTIFYAPALVVYSNDYEYLKSVGKGIKLKNKKTRVVGTIHDIRDYEMASGYKQILKHREELNCFPETDFSNHKKHQLIAKNEIFAGKLKKMYKEFCSSPSISTIITVSEYSKKALTSLSGNSCTNKIKVFYAPMKNRPTPLKFDLNTERFALIVNAFRLEKNGQTAISAFDQIFSRKNPFSNDLKVVVTGVDQPENQFTKDLKNKKRFIFLPYLKAEHLEYLYQTTELFVFPSLSEGFGYPPVEAMSYGKTCVVSNITSIPEICGDSVYYFNPYDVNELEEKLTHAYSHKIPEEKICGQHKEVTQRQKRDLKKLINLIIES